MKFWVFKLKIKGFKTQKLQKQTVKKCQGFKMFS